VSQIVQVPGNEQVVKAMTMWLELARQGRVNCAAVVMIQPPDVICDFGGNANMLEGPLRGGIAGLSEAVNAQVAGRAVPPPNEAGADYVTYNFTNGPASYDVFPWLIEAEMRRIREGGPAPLKVHWWMGNDNGGLDGGGLRKQIFENVMRPALALVGAVETDRIGYCPDRFTSIGVVMAAKAGEAVPKLRVPEDARFAGRGYVTITLREMKGYDHRNSNMGAWLKFARYLKGRGERVIFIRDTAKADERLPGFETNAQAARDLYHRLALYESAKCNLFTTNGPTLLGVYGDRPYLIFLKLVPEDHPCYADRASFLLSAHGLAVGDQYPWAAPDQRLVWAKDDYDEIVRAWETFIERKGDAAEARKVTEGNFVEHPHRDQGRPPA